MLGAPKKPADLEGQRTDCNPIYINGCKPSPRAM